MTRRLLTLGSLCIAFTASCSPERQTEPSTVAAVVFTRSVSSVGLGLTEQLGAIAITSTGLTLPDRAITWSSSDTAVVTVSAAGLVSGRSLGSATIAASVDGKSAQLDVAVHDRAIASVVITPLNPRVPVGDSIQLRASVRDIHGDELPGRRVSWSVTTPDGNSVTAAGMFHTISSGLSRVTATSDTVVGAVFIRVLTPPAATIDIEPAFQFLFPSAHADVRVAGNVFTTARDSTGKITGDAVITITSSDSSSVQTSPTTTGAVLIGLKVAPSVTITARSGSASVTARARVIGANDIYAGERHMCFLSDLGEAYCWGRNVNGELGIGESDSITVLPRKAKGNVTFASLSAGDAHTCGVTIDGEVYCWGANEEGQLGNGTRQSSLVPVAVSGGLRFKMVSTGWAETCGITTDDRTYCWGRYAASSPSIVPREVSSTARLTTIVVGAQVQCGLDAGSAAYCWGRNESGQTGTGTITEVVGVPTAVTGSRKFKQLVANDAKVCGLTVDGDTFCWGNVGPANTATPAPLEIVSGFKFAKIAMSRTLVCGILADQRTMCAGELPGNGSDNSSTAFVQAAAPFGFFPVTYKSVAVGFTARCVITSPGLPLCWGLGPGNGSPFLTGTTTAPAPLRRPPVE